GDGFEVVVEHVGPRRDHLLDCAALAQKIGCEHFDGGRGAASSERADHCGEMRGPTVIEVVAVDRGHDDVLEPKCRGRCGDPLGMARARRSADGVEYDGQWNLRSRCRVSGSYLRTGGPSGKGRLPRQSGVSPASATCG